MIRFLSFAIDFNFESLNIRSLFVFITGGKGLFLQPVMEVSKNLAFFIAAAEQVELVKKPGMIVGPIAQMLGYLCDYLFNFVSGIFSRGTLGITIIIFTIIVRIILLPLAAYSAKSMAKMKVIQPEMKKIQNKYKGKTDDESKRRMSAEVTALQKDNGVNPANGCLPLIIQLPIIYALFSILNRAYLYIEDLGKLYNQMSTIILNVSGIGRKMYDIVLQMPTLKKFVEKNSVFDLSFGDNCREVLSKMSDADWTNFLQSIPSDVVNQLKPLLEQKANIEYFFGINLVERPSFLAVSVLIPLLSAASTFLSTWLMNKGQATPTDEAAKMQQRYMLIAMPLLMGFMAFTLPAGLGLYWTVGNIFQIGQQYVFNKLFDPDKGKAEKAQ